MSVYILCTSSGPLGPHPCFLEISITTHGGDMNIFVGKPNFNCIVPTSKAGPIETAPSFINKVVCFEPLPEQFPEGEK